MENYKAVETYEEGVAIIAAGGSLEFNAKSNMRGDDGDTFQAHPSLSGWVPISLTLIDSVGFNQLKNKGAFRTTIVN